MGDFIVTPYHESIPIGITPHADYKLCFSCGGKKFINDKVCYRCSGQGIVFNKELAERLLALLTKVD